VAHLIAEKSRQSSAPKKGHDNFQNKNNERNPRKNLLLQQQLYMRKLHLRMQVHRRKQLRMPRRQSMHVQLLLNQ